MPSRPANGHDFGRVKSMSFVYGLAEPFSDACTGFSSNCYKRAMLQPIVFKPLIACDTFLHPSRTNPEFARRDRQRVTLGNYKRYSTHSLQRVKSSAGSSAKSPVWYDHFQEGELVLQRTADRQPGNPFLVARLHQTSSTGTTVSGATI